ncbi:hypothetical protein II906_07065 [bacterium]|nr:hypothetical protein [bacterium]
MKKFILLIFILVLSADFVLSAEILELSDVIKQAKNEAKMAQLQTTDNVKQTKNDNNLNKQEQNASEKIETEDISSIPANNSF